MVGLQAVLLFFFFIERRGEYAVPQVMGQGRLRRRCPAE